MTKETVVYLNNGHHLLDPGAWHPANAENVLTIELGRAVEKLLVEEKIVFESVPDELDLKKTISWINERAGINDVAFSIHFNSHRGANIRGTEAYYYNQREKELAEIYSRNVSQALGIPNRGAKPDRETWVGSLGWVRKLKCDSVLVEVCYLSNALDMDAYDVNKAAKGILNAIKEILPRKDPIVAIRYGRKIADLQKLHLSLLQKLIALLIKKLALLQAKLRV